jgi:hypothetical protein
MQMSIEPVQCPKCGYRADLSADTYRLMDPYSKCLHKDGPLACPDLAADFSEAHMLQSAPKNNLVLAKRAKRLERLGNEEAR